MSLLLAVSILGGLLLIVSELTSAGTAVAAIGSVLFGVGLLLAFALGVRDARRSGGTVLRSIGRGFRTLWGWFSQLVP